MDNPTGYYTQQPNSKVLKPQEYIQDKEQLRTAIADGIFATFEKNSMPSWEASEILHRVQQKVIACQGKLDQAYRQKIQKEKDR